MSDEVVFRCGCNKTAPCPQASRLLASGMRAHLRMHLLAQQKAEPGPHRIAQALAETRRNIEEILRHGREL